MGEIDLPSAGVESGGNGGGSVVIRSGCLTLDDATIDASSKGAVGSGVSIAPLPEDFRSIIALLRKPCMELIG